MRVLVTGATGFIDSHTVAELVRQGHDVSLFVRTPERVSVALDPLGMSGCPSTVGDVTDAAAVEAAMRSCSGCWRTSRRAFEGARASVCGCRPVYIFAWRETIMARVPYLDRADLPEDQRHVFDRIAGSRGSVGNVFRAMLNSPGATEVVAAVGEYVRYRSTLDPIVREIAVLSTAREHDNDYEWAHHESLARDAGVRDEVIEAIRSGRAPMGLPAKEGVFAQAARELVRDGTLSDRTYQAVEHLLGRQGTVELVVTVGYYTMLSRVMTALCVELEEETPC